MYYYYRKEDVVLRSTTKPAGDLERFSRLGGRWKPYFYRGPEIEHLFALTKAQAIEELGYNGVKNPERYVE